MKLRADSADPVAAPRYILLLSDQGNPATTEQSPEKRNSMARSAGLKTGKTASAEEIERFAAVADSWWDRDGAFRALHRLNPTRIGFIRDHVAAHFRRRVTADGLLEGLDLLDIGCGGGLLSEPMARLGANVTGIDADEEGVSVARDHAGRVGLDIDYRRALPEDLAARGMTFDVVLNMEVVEHVADVDAFLEACCKLLKPGGVMGISTINRTLKSLALAKVGAEYILRWVPAGTHTWSKFVKPSELARGLRIRGVRITDLRGMTYSPLTGEWALSRDLAVNYLAFAVKEG